MGAWKGYRGRRQKELYLIAESATPPPPELSWKPHLQLLFILISHPLLQDDLGNVVSYLPPTLEGPTAKEEGGNDYQIGNVSDDEEKNTHEVRILERKNCKQNSRYHCPAWIYRSDLSRTP